MCVVDYSGTDCYVAKDKPANLGSIDQPTPCCSPGYDRNSGGERQCEIVAMSVTNVGDNPKCRTVNAVCSLWIICFFFFENSARLLCEMQIYLVSLIWHETNIFWLHLVLSFRPLGISSILESGYLYFLQLK